MPRNQGQSAAQPSTSINRFPWESNGITFRSRAELENVIEQFARAGTKEHINAAQTLLRRAIGASKLTADQYNEMIKRLHL